MKKLNKRTIPLISAFLLAFSFFVLPYNANEVEQSKNKVINNNFVQINNTETTTSVTLDDIPIPLITTPMASYTGWNAMVIQSRLRFTITSKSTDDYSLDIKLLVPYFNESSGNAYMESHVNLKSFMDNRKLPIKDSVMTPTQIHDYWNNTIDTSLIDNENDGFYYRDNMFGQNNDASFRGNMYQLIYSANPSYGGDYFTLRGDLTPTTQQTINNYGSTVGTFFTAYLEKPTTSTQNGFNVNTLSSITIKYYTSNYGWLTELVRSSGSKKIMYNQFTEYVFFDGLNSIHFVFPTFNQPIFETYNATTNDIYSYISTYYIQSKESDNDSIYNDAYDLGYQAGERNSQEKAFDDGYKTGKDEGEDIGWQKGYEYGLSQSNTFSDLMFSVIDAPVHIFTSLLNFDILGLNMSQFVLSLLSMGLLLAVLRFII